MPRPLDETHDPAARSWVASENDGDTDFPVQNLPFGVFRRRGTSDEPRVGVAVGDEVLDLRECVVRGVLAHDRALARVAEALLAPLLNPLMALGSTHWRALRLELFRLLRGGGEREAERRSAAGPCLVPAAAVDMLLPAAVGDYTDFYASLHHASNVGRMMRPDNPLLPNYKWVPIGYHGRASSIVVSGTPVRRPFGQTRPDGADVPAVGPTRRLDYELEVGAYVGPGNRHGVAIPVADAEEHLFGLCLVNDWSARDVQAWEYQPLGPFLAKSFATTVSPWVVTLEALAPCRAPQVARPSGDPQPLAYLDHDEGRRSGAFALTLDVYIQTARMRATGVAPFRVSRASFAELYWTMAQLVAHHASNGCNLRPGDLVASGTVSGAERGSRGCLLELTWRGQDTIELPGGEQRTFLEDGDEVLFRAMSGSSGFRRLGFGDCRGRVESPIGG